MLRKLGAYRQQNQVHLALGEFGRIERFLFMLDWIESPQLRMECQAGLSKGEARHTLARAVFALSRGRMGQDVSKVRRSRSWLLTSGGARLHHICRRKVPA